MFEMTIGYGSQSSAYAPALQVQPASAFAAVRSLFAAHPAFRGQSAEEESERRLSCPTIYTGSERRGPREVLWGRLFDQGFASQSWLTFRQALSLGGNVRKGEHGVSVCYADKFIPKRDRSNGAGGEASSGKGDRNDEVEAVPFLRRYTVFNVAQCDNLPDHWRSRYAVCPVCRTRAPITGYIQDMQCANCNGQFGIAWDERYLAPE